MYCIYAPHRVKTNTEHYRDVKREMERRGSLVIRAAWTETHGAWLAIEGSHRLQAALDLGIDDVTVVDVTNDTSIGHDIDGIDSPCAASDLAAWLLDLRRLNATLTLKADVARGRYAIEQYASEDE